MSVKQKVKKKSAVTKWENLIGLDVKDSSTEG